MELHQDQLALLRTLMSEKRFAHCERVAHMAVRLAERWGANVKQANLAGLLHDAAKEMGPENVLAHGISIPESHNVVIRDYFPIWHAFIGPEVVRALFDCHDEVVHEAIHWHTTGDGDMSLLAQILFVADYIEEGRPWSFRQSLEDLAFSDLDAATWAVSVKTNERVREKGADLHVASEACQAFYAKRVTQSHQRDIMAEISL